MALALISLSAAGFAAWAGVMAVIPSFIDAGKSLTRTAKRVAAGPHSPEEAVKMHKDLDLAVTKYLKEIGTLKTAQIAAKLQQELHSSAYEVHAFDLPRNLKVVEVDTGLQACDYLVMQDHASAKVFPLPGLEVFDDGRVISESGAPSLVLLGHTGQGVPSPEVKVFALLPGDIADETEKTVPLINAEGKASFGRNDKDVNLNLSLWSMGTGRCLFKNPPNVVAREDDENVRVALEWQDGHYKARPILGAKPLSAVYALAATSVDPSDDQFRFFLGKNGVDFAKQIAASKGQFVVEELASSTTIVKGRHKRSHTVGIASYLLKGANGAYKVDLKEIGNNWKFVAGQQLSDDEVKVAEQQSKPTDITASMTTVPGVGILAGAAAKFTANGSALDLTPAKIVVKDVAKGDIPVSTKSAPTDSTTSTIASLAVPTVQPIAVHASKQSPAPIVIKSSGSSKPVAVAPAPVVTKPTPPAPAKVANASALVSIGKSVNTSTQPKDAIASTETQSTGSKVRSSLTQPTDSKLASSGKPSFDSTAQKNSKNTDFSKLASAVSSKSKDSSSKKNSTKHQVVSSNNTVVQSAAIDALANRAESKASAWLNSSNHSAEGGGAPVAASTTRSTSTSTPSTTSPKVASIQNAQSGVSTTSKRSTTAAKPAESTTETTSVVHAPDSTNSKPGQTVVISSEGVILRRGPATEYRQLGAVAKGEKVEVLGKEKGWYHVRSNGREGYVYGAFAEAKADNYTKATVKQIASVTGADKKPVAPPKAGDKVVVLGGIQDGKYKVQLANGKVGYVDKDAIDVKEDAPQFVP